MGADSTSLDQNGGGSFCLCYLFQVAALASAIKRFPFKLNYLSLLALLRGCSLQPAQPRLDRCSVTAVPGAHSAGTHLTALIA